MKLVKLAFVIAGIALFALACGETSVPPTNQTAGGGAQASPAISPKETPAKSPTPTDELAAARTTFGQVCSACHGDQGDGGVVTIEGKKLKVPSLKKGHALTHTDEQLAKIIANGEEGMPAFKDRFNQEQINGLVRFIRREFQAGATSAQATPPAPKS